MAVLQEMGLQVQVLVDGSPAQEYRDNVVEDVGDGIGSSPSSRHRYIESIAGAKLAVSLAAVPTCGSTRAWYDDDDDHIVRLLISIDGKDSGTAWIHRKSKVRVVEGVYDRDTMRPFQFAAIDLIEDAAEELVAEHKDQSKDLGIIKISAHKVIRITHARTASKLKPKNKNATAGSGNRDTLPFGDGGLELSEKALKGRAIAHGTTLGPTIACKSNKSSTHKVTKLEWVDPKDKPCAIFTFAYRSRDALQQELIIPRTPRAAPLTIDDLSPQEIRQLAQERLSDSHNRKRGASVKNEPDRPVKFFRTANERKVIDLTDD